MYVATAKDAYLQAQANANQTKEIWCVFIDSSGNYRVERENQAPNILILRRFTPEEKK